MNFTTRPLIGVHEVADGASEFNEQIAGNSVGESTCVSLVKPVRSAKPMPHVTLADASVMTPSKCVRAADDVLSEDRVDQHAEAMGDLGDRTICHGRGRVRHR